MYSIARKGHALHGGAVADVLHAIAVLRELPEDLDLSHEQRARLGRVRREDLHCAGLSLRVDRIEDPRKRACTDEALQVVATGQRGVDERFRVLSGHCAIRVTSLRNIVRCFARR
jgi:hypothetical protein